MTTLTMRDRAVCLPFGVVCPACHQVMLAHGVNGREAELSCKTVGCELIGKRLRAHLPTIEIEIMER